MLSTNTESEAGSDGSRSHGTPMTLEEAIQRALEEIRGLPSSTEDEQIQVIHRRVKDFLAQKFSLAMCGELDLKTLWSHIFPSEKQRTQ